MTETEEKSADRSYKNTLYPEDQARVDEFTKSGINSVDRKPFKPMRLLIMLIAIVFSYYVVAIPNSSSSFVL